jgi:hypothetical protein
MLMFITRGFGKECNDSGTEYALIVDTAHTHAKANTPQSKPKHRKKIENKTENEIM